MLFRSPAALFFQGIARGNAAAMAAFLAGSHDPKKWWEVMDRTTGQAVPASQWELTGAFMPEGFGDGREFKGVFEGTGEAGEAAGAGKTAGAGDAAETKEAEGNSAPMRVVLEHASPFHEYTVSFLVYAVWDPTQMYNHITNNWGDKPHEIPFDEIGRASCRERV